MRLRNGILITMEMLQTYALSCVFFFCFVKSIIWKEYFICYPLRHLKVSQMLFLKVYWYKRLFQYICDRGRSYICCNFCFRLTCGLFYFSLAKGPGCIKNKCKFSAWPPLFVLVPHQWKRKQEKVWRAKMKGHVLDGTMKDVNQENYLAIKGEVSISHFTCIRHSFTTDLFLVLKKNPPFVKPL